MSSYRVKIIERHTVPRGFDIHLPARIGLESYNALDASGRTGSIRSKVRIVLKAVRASLRNKGKKEIEAREGRSLSSVS